MVALRAIVDAGHDVAVVVSRADKRRGRHEAARPSPVKAAALELGLPVSSRPEDAAEVGAELGVVVAFGRIIKKDVLDRLPLVNAHFSLLPRWRGAAPVERAILAGDPATGVCLMAIDEGLDTGPVYRCEATDIGQEETAPELRSRLADQAAAMLVDLLATGPGTPTPQAGTPTYADKIEPADLWLDWSLDAVQLHRIVRLGRAWTTWRDHRLLVLAGQVADPPAGGGPPGSWTVTWWRPGAGGLRLLTVQPEGRGPLAVADWRRGARPRPGELLGS